MPVRTLTTAVAFLLLAIPSYAAGVEWKVSAGRARVKGNETRQPVVVTWTNRAETPRTLNGTVTVVDYYMRPLADAKFPGKLGAGESLKTVLDIPTDQAGPYVKVRLEVSSGGSVSVLDEQIVFTEVLTGPRRRMSLNGAWQMNKGDGKWGPCELPYRWDSWTGWHRRQFRKRFILPAQMKGRQIELQLGGIRFHVKVSLNGKVLAEQHTDQMPLTVDLTPAAKPGEKNEIVLEITDWLSCASPEEQPKLWKVWSSAWMQGREIPGFPFIRPATCGLGAAGVGDPIYIIATEPQAVENVFVTPSVRKSQLAIRTELRNDAKTPRDLTVRLRVLDGEKTILQAESKPVKLAPGQTKLREIIPFDPKAVQLWWPWKPKLYRLRVDLLDGKTLVDRYDVRFGIREFWCDGPVFRINGVPIRPRAAAGIPYDYPGLAFYDDRSSLRTWNLCKNFLRSFQNVNVNLVRYHTEPFPILMFDQADELGLMIVSEAWMATLPGKMKLSDPRTWQAMREFYPKWVRREFNHPCLVIRSMENELGYHLPRKDQPRSPWGYSHEVVEEIARNMRLLGKVVKQLDPSRPIMYEGSGPIFYGVADIYNLHYPGISGGADLWPITARVMSIPIASYREKAWLWDRKKPLYIGEYDCCYGTPAGFVPLMGDDAYVPAYLIPAEAARWNLSMPGQRIDGVTTGFPHSPLTFNSNLPVLDPNTNGLLRLFADMYTPVATFIHQYRICYFGGSRITRTVTTLNDSLKTREITVRWSLTGANGKVVLHGEKTLTLGPAESTRTQIPLALPIVKTPRDFTFTVDTLAEGKSTYTESRKFVLYPKDKPAPTLRARYGVVGAPVEPFQARGAKVKVLTPAQLDLNDIDVMIVAGDGKKLQPQAEKIDAFLRRGGRVIVLAGKEVPAFLPVKFDLPKIASPLTFADDANPGKSHTVPAPGSSVTILHPRIPGHPVLAGLGQDQLRYWRESHVTADYTWNKPKDYSSWSLIECGHGFSRTALLEIPHGKGVLLATTMPILELAGDQPAAAILLDNILSYADSYKSVEHPQVVGLLAGEKNQIEPMLEELGVTFYLLTGKLDKLNDLSSYGVVIVSAEKTSLDELEKNIEKVRQYVRGGGVVWLQGPTPKQSAQISELIGRKVNIKPYTLTKPIHTKNRGLLVGVTNDELFWPEGSFLPPPSKRVAKHTVHVDGEGVEVLAKPEVAVSIADGKGYWLFDEVTWPGEIPQRQRAAQYVRAILPNLGLQVRRSNKVIERVFDESLGYAPVDIAKFCNEGFLGGIWNGPKMGIQGLPVGEQIFDGNLYWIVDPKTNGQKACVGFRSKEQNKGGVESVTVPVGKKAACVQLLLASVWTSSLASGTKILNIEIEYADGTGKSTEVCYGRDVLDWCTSPIGAARMHPRKAWMGKKWPQPGLFDFTWINPEPQKVIRSITLRAANDMGFAVLFAVTTQQKLSKAEKKQSDWIPGQEK